MGTNLSFSSYSYLFGPTYAWHLKQVTPFLHGLVGGVFWRSNLTQSGVGSWWRAGSKDGPPAFCRSDRAVGLSGEQGAERDKRIELALLVRTRLRLLEPVGLYTSPFFGEVDWRNSAQ